MVRVLQQRGLRRPMLLALALAVLGGCQKSGPDVGYVEGTVTLDEKPLSGALVTFLPETGRPSFGRTNDEGWYELIYTEDLNGALVGEHKVEITTFTSGDPDQGIKKVPEKLPARYNQESELTATVESGDNEIPFDLTSEGEVVQPPEG